METGAKIIFTIIVLAIILALWPWIAMILGFLLGIGLIGFGALAYLLYHIPYGGALIWIVFFIFVGVMMRRSWKRGY